MTDEKRHEISPADHPYKRPSKLTDEQFVEWVKTMPRETLRKKMTGSGGREFERRFDEAARRVAEKTNG